MQKAHRVLVTGRAESEEQKRKAAAWAVQPASPQLIVEMLKKMQGLKGRFYSEVAERMYGQEVGLDQLTHVERSISEMMYAKRITLSELTHWYKLSIETRFDGDRFTPLPGYTDCVKLVEQARERTRRLQEVAGTIIEPAPVVEEIKRIAQGSTLKTLPELFEELKAKLGDDKESRYHGDE